MRASPSRSSVRASKPNSSRARVTSSCRRGWPFGIEVSHSISPSKPVSSAISVARSRIEISCPVPRLTGSGSVVALGGEEQALGGVLDVEELAGRASRRPRARSGARSRASSGSGRESRARRWGGSCRAARTGSRAAGGSRWCRTARGTTGLRPAPTSSRRRRARSSPPDTRSRGRSRGTAPGVNFGYSQIVPSVTSFGVSARRASSRTCAPIIRFAYQ